MQSIGSTEVKVKPATPKANGRKKSARSEAKETLRLKSKETGSMPSEQEINGMIATAAYFCAQQRQFEPGRELEDWLTAERQIKATLLG